ncbi:MAG: hypothetical protein ACJ790_00855 [Myxococcaceae bacterium]
MSEQQTEPAVSDAAKKDEALKVLTEILGKMGLSGSYDVKDATDGSISIAMTLSGELPGAALGKRSHVVDSLQFLINKIINRTPQNRRWISLGLGEHPAPRQPKPQRQPQQPAAQATAAPTAQAAPQADGQPHTQPPPKQGRREREREPKPPQPPQQRREPQLDEASVEVAEDAALAGSARELAERAAKHGRLMAVIGMSVEDRARLVKAAKQVPGVSVKTEGEGRNRRVVVLPDKPTPMPKQNLPVYDDEEDEDEE